MTIDPRQLLLLLNWMSPAFPTGAFAYSHGLEWAIESGAVKSRGDVKAWVEDVITRGSGRNDAVIFARCWDEDRDALNELALALSSSRERWLETTQLGKAFQVAAGVFAKSPHPPFGHLLPRKRAGEGDNHHVPSPVAQPWEKVADRPDEGPFAYPVAAGFACKDMGIGRNEALIAFLQGFVAALTSVAVRLIPLGQTAGLEVLRDLMPAIADVARRAGEAALDDLGSAALLSDIAAMKHETLEPRVFRT